uniref:transmembrane protease serine 2-like n=1 Tax=Pristiophorus japonicus TaxID=55135 RepID=UPI00398F5DA4
MTVIENKHRIINLNVTRYSRAIVVYVMPVLPGFYMIIEIRGEVLYMDPNYSPNAQHVFRGQSSFMYNPPSLNPYVPPTYGSQSFNQNSFVAVQGKKKHIIIGLIVAGVVFAFGIISAIIWYFVSHSNCMPCGSSNECVLSSQWCDGVPQCAKGEDEECFRLAGTEFVLYAKFATYGWRPVCYDNWNTDHGKQVCNIIGYPRGSYSNFGSVSVRNVSSSVFLMLNESLKARRTYQQLSISKICNSGLVVTLHCIECGVHKEIQNHSERIVGGDPVIEGEFPWQVSLHLKKYHVCGGTIITPHWIVTAAHCGERYPTTHYWQVYGGILRQAETQFLPPHLVEKFIRHKMFDPVNKDYDIALMKLKTPFRFSEIMRPACLPNYGQRFPSNSNGWISGWGDLKEGGSPSEILQKAMVPLISFNDCKTIYYKDITTRMFCAGFEEGGTDACQGDSGGPFVVWQKSIWWLVGATSWGYGCARAGHPGVYTKIIEFLDWIYFQLKATTARRKKALQATPPPPVEEVAEEVNVRSLAPKLCQEKFNDLSRVVKSAPQMSAERFGSESQHPTYWMLMYLFCA